MGSAYKTRSINPIGLIFDHGGTSAPRNALICNGAAVSRAEYPKLFTAIGTTWGAGDGVTTFNLPSLLNRVTRGNGDSAVGTLQEDQNKAHTHSVTGTAASAGSHTHSITKDANLSNNSSNTCASGYNDQTDGGLAYTNASGAHTHSVTGTAATNGGAEVRVKAGITLKCIWVR